MELDQSEVDHRIENVMNANKVLVQRLEFFCLRLDKLERTQMDDMIRVDKLFEQQKNTIAEIELRINEIKI